MIPYDELMKITNEYQPDQAYELVLLNKAHTKKQKLFVSSRNRADNRLSAIRT